MPTLGEVAAFNRNLMGNMDIGGSFLKGVQIAQTLQNIEINRYALQQQQAKDALDILTGTYQNPIWKTGNPEDGLTLIRQVRDQIKARNIPLNPGNVVDQVEGMLAESLLNKDPQKMQSARDYLRDTINQFGHDRATRIQPQLGASGGNPASVIQGDIGSQGRVQVYPVDVNQPGVTQNGVTQRVSPNTNQPQPAQAPAATSGQGSNFYPNRPVGSIVPYYQGEPEDIKRGESIKSNLTTVQKTIGQQKFNVNTALNESNKIVEGRLFDVGLSGDIERSFEKNFQNNASYDKLAKAQAQILVSNANQGLLGRSDAGQALVETANGLIAGGKVPPPSVVRDMVLQNAGAIAQQDLFAKASQNFLKTPAGANNIANLAVFERTFNELASGDFRIFQIVGVMQSNMPQKDKVKAVEYILQGTTREEREQIKKSGKRLEQFVATGN